MLADLVGFDFFGMALMVIFYNFLQKFYFYVLYFVYLFFCISIQILSS